MRAVLLPVIAAALVLGPAHSDKKPPKPPVDGKVPYGMCSVVDIVVKSKQHPCPED